jgi:hypothetical protein
MDSRRYEKQHAHIGHRRLIQLKEGKGAKQSRMDNLLHQDRTTINRNILGEVEHSELVPGRNVRPLCAAPICTGSGRVLLGGTMVCHALL